MDHQTKRKGESIVGMAKERYRQYPVFLFLVVFAVFMGLFYVFALFLPFYERHFPYYLGFNARLSGYILAFLGQNITVEGASISSPAFSITIARGCDAIEPTALFICAVLAFPERFVKKIWGIITGTLLLAFLNLIRIVTLFLIGVYFHKAFHITHVDVWQAMFIFFAVILWILWLLWATQSQISIQRASE
jgi:exosortase/archaeosortase family protein